MLHSRAIALARQGRAHIRLVFSPISVGFLIAVALLAAFRARNAPVGIDESGATAHLADALRIALLQSATMAGVVLAGTAGASLAAFVSADRSEETMSILEPSWWRRWALRQIAILAFLSTAILMIAGAVFAAAFVQASRLPGTAQVALGKWDELPLLSARVLLVLLLFASGSVVLASLLRGNPALVIGVSVAGVLSLLLLQHLTGGLGAVIVPTAWIGRWLHLVGDDFGAGYFWTSGAFSGARAPAGLGIAVLSFFFAIVGSAIVARAGRS